MFLAEAFTRPPMLHSLAGAGFQQSYTYFTWRNTKLELEEFLTELSQDDRRLPAPEPVREHPRHPHRVPAVRRAARLQDPGGDRRDRLAELGRVLRATSCSRTSPGPGSEENIDNEKYEYKQRDWAKAEAAGASLAPYLTLLNAIRAEHPALRAAAQPARALERRRRGARLREGPRRPVHTRTGRADALIVVANVDPHSVRETTVHLDLTAVRPRARRARFGVRDLIPARAGPGADSNYVRLDAFTEPVHILAVESGRA